MSKKTRRIWGEGRNTQPAVVLIEVQSASQEVYILPRAETLPDTGRHEVDCVACVATALRRPQWQASGSSNVSPIKVQSSSHQTPMEHGNFFSS